MNGEYIDSCKKCYRDEDLGKSSYRQHFNNRYDLKLPAKIRELELALSNKCNFKCIICGWDRSSRWYQDEKLLNSIVPRLDVPIASGARVMPETVTEKIIDADIDKIDFTKVDNLALQGGEPLLDEKIYITITKSLFIIFA